MEERQISYDGTTYIMDELLHCAFFIRKKSCLNMNKRIGYRKSIRSFSFKIEVKYPSPEDEVKY